MEVLGYALAVFIGVVLGLIGGGGSILAVPVLVYVFHLDPTIATSYSLFIVGVTSLAGAGFQAAKGNVDFRAIVAFGITSVLTVFLTRKYVLPMIPEELFSVAGFAVYRSAAIMVLFSALMLASSVSMILGYDRGDNNQKGRFVLAQLGMLGVGIGLVTGLLGAGGGFLIIPTLVILAQMPIKRAIGTSLLIIAINSLVGFAGDIGHVRVEWKFLLSFLSVTVAGVIVGSLLGRHVSGDRLRGGFGWFLLTMGIYILSRELF